MEFFNVTAMGVQLSTELKRLAIYLVSTIHTRCHTCASRLVQGGVDIRVYKDWMGHTTIQTTMIYAHLAPTDLFVGADVLDQVSPTVSDGSTNVVSMGQNGGTK